MKERAHREREALMDLSPTEEEDPVKIGARALGDEIDYLNEEGLISDLEGGKAYDHLAKAVKIISAGRERGWLQIHAAKKKEMID
jgi:hypothetical protein